MFFNGPNGKLCSTLSGAELLALNNTDEFWENAKIVAEKTGNLNLFEEMFGDIDDGRGQDSAFMDDMFGG